MNLIRIICTVAFTIGIMYMLLDCEIKTRKKLFQLVAFITLTIIFDGLFFLNYGYSGFMYQYPFLVQLPMFFAFWMVSKHKASKVFFILLTAVAVSSALVVIGSIISYLSGFDEKIVNIICLSIYIPTLIIFQKYFRQTILYMLRNTEKGWLLFCLIPFLSIILVYSVGENNVYTVMNGSSLIISILTLVLSFASYALIFLFFKRTREQLILINEHTLLNMQVAASKQHLNSLQDSQEKTILYRHDMRHHLNLIHSYLLDNNIEAAQRHIADVEKSIENTIVETYCRNYSLNLILNYYIAKAKNESITVECKVNIPEDLSISTMDLCVVFSNALENAINASKQIATVKDRVLRIDCHIQNDRLFIKAANHYEGSVLFIGDTPARNPENKGVGTKSIAAVAEKYNGLYSFTAENGLFTAIIIL